VVGVFDSAMESGLLVLLRPSFDAPVAVVGVVTVFEISRRLAGLWGADLADFVDLEALLMTVLEITEGNAGSTGRG
jgi:hypothetical protein